MMEALPAHLQDLFKTLDENLEIQDYKTARILLAQVEHFLELNPLAAELLALVREKTKKVQLTVETGLIWQEFNKYKQRAVHAKKVGHERDEFTALQKLRYYANELYKVGKMNESAFKKIDQKYQKLLKVMERRTACINDDENPHCQISTPDEAQEPQVITPPDKNLKVPPETRPEFPKEVRRSKNESIEEDAQIQENRVSGIDADSIQVEVPIIIPEETVKPKSPFSLQFPPWLSPDLPKLFTTIPTSLIFGENTPPVEVRARISKSEGKKSAVLLLLLTTHLPRGVTAVISPTGEFKLQATPGVKSEGESTPVALKRAKSRYKMLCNERDAFTSRFQKDEAYRDKILSKCGLSVEPIRGLQGRCLGLRGGSKKEIQWRVVYLNAFLLDAIPSNKIDPGFPLVHDHRGSYFVPPFAWAELLKYLAKRQDCEVRLDPTLPNRIQSDTIPTTFFKRTVIFGLLCALYGLVSLLLHASPLFYGAVKIFPYILTGLLLSMGGLMAQAYYQSWTLEREWARGFLFRPLRGKDLDLDYLGKPAFWLQAVADVDSWDQARTLVREKLDWDSSEMAHHPYIRALKYFEPGGSTDGFLVEILRQSYRALPPIAASCLAYRVLRYEIMVILHEVRRSPELSLGIPKDPWKFATALCDHFNKNWLGANLREHFLPLLREIKNTTEWTDDQRHAFTKGSLVMGEVLEVIRAAGNHPKVREVIKRILTEPIDSAPRNEEVMVNNENEGLHTQKDTSHEVQNIAPSSIPAPSMTSATAKRPPLQNESAFLNVLLDPRRHLDATNEFLSDILAEETRL